MRGGHRSKKWAVGVTEERKGDFVAPLQWAEKTSTTICLNILQTLYLYCRFINMELYCFYSIGSAIQGIVILLLILVILHLQILEPLQERQNVNSGASQETIERCTYPHKYKKVRIYSVGCLHY